VTADERQRLREEIDQRRRDRLQIVGPAAPSATPLEARRQVGRRQVEAMRAAYRQLGRTTQARAAKLAGVPDGVRTWATRALIEEGVIRATGRVVERSPEYELAAHR